MEDDGEDPDNPVIFYANLGDFLKLKHALESNTEIDINGKDFWGCTALGHATKGGHLDCVKYLIEKGAEVEVTDKKGQTPLFSAVFSSRTDVVDLLLENGADPMGSPQNISFPLKIAVMNGDIDIAKSLIDFGAEVNCVRDCVTSMSGPPLSSALNRGQSDLLKLLLKAGANPNFCNEHKHELLNTESPFEIAIRRNLELEFFQILYEFGCRTSSTAKQKGELWELAQNIAVKEFLYNTRYIPRNLKSCCRLILQQKYAKTLSKYVQTFDIPSSLKQYLLYHDVL